MELISASRAGGAEGTAVGGKAQGLGRLVEAGAPVPPFFVVPVRAFREHAARSAFAGRLGELLFALADGCDDETRPPLLARYAETLGAEILRTPLRTELAAEVASELGSLGPGPYAVRSSMVGEDSGAHSFAGQLESFLYCWTSDDVCDAIRRCWVSAFSSRALAYALRVGLDLPSVGVGVVVQQMFDSRVAGVLFTANPVNGSLDECLVAAAWGQGEGVVSGAANTDEYVWRRGHGTVNTTVADKDVQVIGSRSGTGTEEVPVDEKDRNRPCLSPEQVDSLCEVAVSVADRFGYPLDIEWAFDQSGRLALLQARPVTSLPGPKPQGDEILWDNSNIQESYCGVTTPLTYSYALRAYSGVYDTVFRMIGVPKHVMDEHKHDFENLLGLIRGRVFYNLNSWYAMVLLLPPPEHSKTDMEKMMGVEEPIDFVEDENLSLSERILRYGKMIPVAARLAPQLRRADRIIAEFNEKFERVYGSVDRRRLGERPLSELIRLTRWLDTEIGLRWEAPIINDIRVMRSTGNLRRFIEKHCEGLDPDATVNDLLAGIEGIESIEPTRRLLKMTDTIRSDPSLVALVKSGSPEASMSAIVSRGGDLAADMNDYIERYGDRCMGELKLETISLRDDPAFVIEMIRNYLDRPDLSAETLTNREREHFAAARDRVASAAGERQRTKFKKALDLARESVKAREALRLDRTRGFGLTRDIYVAIGRRLEDARQLEHRRDVFYLTVEEIRAYYDGRAVTTDLKALVELRKREFHEYESEDVANRFRTLGAVYYGNNLDPKPERAVDPALERLVGSGCYPGIVESEARVILSPKDELSVNGKILVTVRTDPGWAPLFPTTGGLLVERGSTLSHSAVVARELGIPAIVGIPGLTGVVVDGERLRMDGGTGVVDRLSAAPPSPEPIESAVNAS